MTSIDKKNLVSTIVVALVSNMETWGYRGVRWPFGVDRVDAVVRILGLDPKERYEKPRPRTDGRAPLGADAGRRLVAIDRLLTAQAAGKRVETVLPSSDQLLKAGWARASANYPELRGPNKQAWADLFRVCAEVDVAALEAAVELSKEAHILLVGDRRSTPVDPVDVTPSRVSDDGSRSWTF